MQGRFARSDAALNERCTSFVQLQVWPLTQQLDWRGWLSNFSTLQEQFFARCLLEAFLYYSTAHSDALLLAAFHALSRDVCNGSDADERERQWSTFVDKVLVTYAEGERPSPTDSGLGFARRGRLVLGIPEDRILSPQKTLEVLERDPTVPVVFVDDFLGSGKQFETTWFRDYSGRSFASLSSHSSPSRWYIPLLATEYGVNRVRPLISGAKVCPAHTLTNRYSALSDHSMIWPPGRLDDARDFVEIASQRAGYPTSECWGFHRLALCVGILDTIPDASLPLFYSTRNSWRPLIRRR
jgi:hypothetical protein